MEEPNDINTRLDELIAQARTERPIMGLDEVRNLIATAPVSSSLPDETKSSKSNSGLYLFLLGFGIIAIAAGSWFYINSADEKTSASKNQPVSNVTESQSSISTPANSGVTDNSNIESGKDISSNETAVNEPSPEKGKTAKASETKANEIKTEKVKGESTPLNSTPSKNETYVVTGGDFVMNFQSDDKNVRMRMKEDDLKELSIDGKPVAESDYSKYKDIIEQGKKMMLADKAKTPSTTATNKSAEEQKRDEINTLLYNAFVDELRKDKLIDEDKYSFRLTSSEMLVNGKPQADSRRMKYLELFKKISGRDLDKSTFKFDHGMN